MSAGPWPLLSSRNMIGVNIHHLKLGCSCQRLARTRQRGHFYMPDSMTAARQSILTLFRLLLQRCPLANPDSYVSLRVSVVLYWDKTAQGGQRSRSCNNWAALSSYYCLLSITAAQKDNLAEVESADLWQLLPTIFNWTWHLQMDESCSSRTPSHC